MFRIVFAFVWPFLSGVAHAGCTVISNTVTCTGGTNGASVVVPDTGTNGVTTAGAPYPATLVVSGASGTVSSVTLRLNGYTSHTGAMGNASRNVGILLESPSGQNLEVMRADGSATGTQSNLTVLLKDGATALPNTNNTWTTSGTFSPTDYDGPGSPNYAAGGGPSTFNTAAPFGTSTMASVFDGDTVNGTWSLYLVDDAAPANIAFSSWDLTITFLPASTTSTTTLTTACPTTFVAGDTFTMTATVNGTSPSGSVDFTDGGVSIVGCASVSVVAAHSACTTSKLATGMRSITAAYSGDAINTPSNSAPLLVTVLDPADAVFLDGFEEITSGCPGS